MVFGLLAGAPPQKGRRQRFRVALTTIQGGLPRRVFRSGPGRYTALVNQNLRRALFGPAQDGTWRLPAGQGP